MKRTWIVNLDVLAGFTLLWELFWLIVWGSFGIIVYTDDAPVWWQIAGAFLLFIIPFMVWLPCGVRIALNYKPKLIRKEYRSSKDIREHYK